MEFPPVFFSGGLTCLDFCNTYDHVQPPPVNECFPDRAAVLQWGRAAGILAADIQDGPRSDPQDFERALRLRALVFRLMLPFTRQEMPAAQDLADFNAALQIAYGQLELVSTEGGYALACSGDDPLEKILCEVIRSAADLLQANQPERIKQCGECGWLFFDATRNGTRRWCDMNICGNRAKARRHYERVRQTRQTAA